MSSEHEGELLLHGHVLAVGEDVEDELGIVELESESERLRISIELPEYFEGRFQQHCVLRLGHVWHAARQVEADPVEGGLIKILCCCFKRVGNNPNLVLTILSCANCHSITVLRCTGTKIIIKYCAFKATIVLLNFKYKRIYVTVGISVPVFSHRKHVLKLYQ